MRNRERGRTGGARTHWSVWRALALIVAVGAVAGATEARASSLAPALAPVALDQQAPPDTVPHYDPEIDPRARQVPHDPAVFKADPSYEGDVYDFQAQLDIYGAKHMNPTQRPLLELGRDLYDRGPFSAAPTPLGAHNILIPQLMLYGDFRTAGAFNDAGAGAGGIGTAAGRLNLELDLRLTATERIHAFFGPLDSGGQFTRFDFTGDSTGFKDNFDAVPDALFFEGDLGAIIGGLIGDDAPFDMPIAAGLMPLLFHNGIWVEDAFTGAAFTIPSRNSRTLDWSNFDITFFAGFDRVSNPAFAGLGDGNGLFGTNWFIEAYEGYIEAGYAYVMAPDASADDDELDLDAPTASDFHSVALSFTKRYGGFLSNSVRYIGSIGGTELGGNGHLLLLENSLITSRPSTFVPYFNLFFALGSPVSAAKAPGAGGILKNTGLNFESDGLTGFPTLFAATNDVMGGAVGLNMLASNIVGGQLVLEVAATVPHSDSPLAGPQFGGGLRLQRPLTNALILRADGMFGVRTDLDSVMGGRVEFRYKF